MMTRSILQTGTALILLVMAGCFAQAQMSDQHDHARTVQNIDLAVAVLHPTEGNDVRGVVLFEEMGDGSVKVSANIIGLQPNSSHGFHIHQYGDATSADGSSAGGHYSPDNHKHGLPDAPGPRHAGDMGNIQADGQGRVRIERVVESVTIAGMNNPILGRGVVVHAEPDDGGQPSGNAGARIAVGVIGVAKPGK